MALATRAENSESEAAIADKVRRNTQRVLEAAKAGNLLPRAAAVALGERRLRKAVAFRRWS
jgi:glutamate dehydrogenase (NAD(P)+)